MVRKLPALLLVAAAAALAGCGEIDTGALEDDIRSGLGDQLSAEGGEEAVESVSCPDGQESETGHTFTCKATFVDGTSLDIEAEVTDGDDGDVRWNAVAPSG